MKKARGLRNGTSRPATNTAIGISAISPRSSGTNSKQLFLPEHTYGSIRCWIGRRSIFGSTLNLRTFPSLISILIEGMGPAIAAWAARPVRLRSNRPPRAWTTSLKNCGTVRSQSGRGGLKTRVGGWRCFEKMDTCDGRMLKQASSGVLGSKKSSWYSPLGKELSRQLGVGGGMLRLQFFLPCSLVGLPV